MWLQSVQLNLRKHWLTYLIVFLIGYIGALIAYWTFPGEDGIQALLGIADTPFAKSIFGELLEGLESENSALFLYFIFLYFIAYMMNVYPVVGLWLGGAGTPSEVENGMADLYLTSPNKKRNLVIRHLFTHVVALTVLTVIIYTLIPITFEILNLNLNYERIFLASILLLISGLTFFSLSFFFSTVTLRADLGRGIATIIYLSSFLINMIINMNPNLKNFENLSLLHYTNPNPVLIYGDPLIIDNLFPIFLSISLVFLGILIFTKRDLIPFTLFITQKKVTKARTTYFTWLRKMITEFWGSTTGLVHKFFAKISSISAEQWAADKTIFLVFFIFCFFGALSIIFGYPTGEGGFAEMAQIYTNNPFAKAIARNSMDELLNDPLGPIYPQFYGYSWLYFFPLVVISASRIIDRDRTGNSLDLLYGNPKNPRTVIFHRIFTIFIELMILNTIILLIIIVGEYGLGIEHKILEQMVTLILTPFAYTSILLFLIAIGLSLSPKRRKNAIYLLGFLTVVLVILPYFSEALMPLRFLSLLYYLDLVGLISQSYQIEHLSLLLVLVITFICSTLYIRIKANTTEYT